MIALCRQVVRGSWKESYFRTTASLSKQSRSRQYVTRINPCGSGSERDEMVPGDRTDLIIDEGAMCDCWARLCYSRLHSIED